MIWVMGPGMNDFASENSERLLWSSVCTPHGMERADALVGDWLIARLLVAQIRFRCVRRFGLGRLMALSMQAKIIVCHARTTSP